MPTAPVIVWLRRDLRLADNPALFHAAATGAAVLPVYIHAPEEEGDWTTGAAGRWWLHHSLAALAGALEECGAGLILRSGDSLETLLALARGSGACAVYWNRALEPAPGVRDSRVRHALQGEGIEVREYPADRLFEPDAVRTRAGAPFRVFTPFWKAALGRGLDLKPLPAPPRLPPLPANPATLPLEALALRPATAWDSGLRAAWRPGEAGARERLQETLATVAPAYAGLRDRPDRAGTSCLSPHLHFGEVSPRQVAAALEMLRVEAPAAAPGALALLRQLGWREFALHLLHHFPETSDSPLDRRYARYPWRETGPALDAWQRGRTGYPLVDAGMRELWTSGWMHNRVRMVAASLLTKNLRIHWLEGARWFWDTLVDADLANNTLGWQWTAGCGADAAPFFRVFNPVRQSERFDPDGVYIRRWVPEIAALPDRWLHAPWTAPGAVQREHGVIIGRDYPAPIVDLRASREEALAAWRATVQNAGK